MGDLEFGFSYERKGKQMPYFEWDESYSVNDEFIDSQHKNIIKAINALIDAIDDGQTSVFCSKLYRALIVYAERHFSHEEKFMKKHDFPGLANQIKEHRYYVNRIEEMHEKFNNDDHDIEIELQMLDFLKEWFYNHILKKDMEYVEFL